MIWLAVEKALYLWLLIVIENNWIIVNHQGYWIFGYLQNHINAKHTDEQVAHRPLYTGVGNSPSCSKLYPHLHVVRPLSLIYTYVNILLYIIVNQRGQRFSGFKSRSSPVSGCILETIGSLKLSNYLSKVFFIDLVCIFLNCSPRDFKLLSSQESWEKI